MSSASTRPPGPIAPIASLPRLVRTAFDERRRPRPTRRAIAGYATGVVSNPRDATHPKRICALEMQAVDDDYISAISADPLPLDARIVLLLPPHGRRMGAELRGTITDCRQRGHSYEITVTLTDDRGAA